MTTGRGGPPALTAADVLVLARVDPDRLAAALPNVVPASVELRPAPGWLRRLWARGTAAMTWRRRIFVRPELLAEPERLGPLVVHELAHVDQWFRLGTARFLLAYVGGYLRGRLRFEPHGEAYRGIELERQARAVAARVTGRAI